MALWTSTDSKVHQENEYGQSTDSCTNVQTVAQPRYNTSYDHLSVTVRRRLKYGTDDHDNATKNDGFTAAQPVAHP